MKKKILKTACYALSVIVASALLAVGMMYLFVNRNVAETGNVLGVEWYDPSGKDFTIDTADELYEFAQLSTYYDFKDQTVKLGADIVINEGNAEDWAETAPARKWTAINGFMGTFDGQGHTISGLYAKGYNAAIALFSNTKGETCIQNFKLVNSYLEARGFGGVASIVSNGGGNLKQIYSDAIINVVGEYSGYAAGICSKVNVKTTIEECWYDGVITTTGRDAGGIVDDVIASTATISHSLFSGEINGTWDYSGTRIGGIVGRTITEGANLTLDDCLSSGKITAGHISYTGSVLGTSMAGTSLKSKNTYAARGIYASIGSSGSNGNIQSLPLEMHADNLIGYKAYQWTNLDFENYWAVVEEGTPILQCFADTTPSLDGIEKAYDISWYSETAGGEITTLEQLYGFYILSGNTDFAGKTVKLGADIALNEGKASDWSKTAPANIWSPINGFSGNFDGQGHTISGMYINSATRFVGFFGMTNKTCTVKNLNIKNSIVINHGEGTAAISTGSVAGVAHGKFENIYSDAIMETTGVYMGGLFGQVYQETTISDCWYDGKITHNGRYAGGIVGCVTNATVNVEHCLNTGELEVIWTNGFCNSGGIVGATLSGNSIKLAVTDCLNVGTITTTTGGTGSVIGHCVKGVTTITDCYAVDGSNAKDNKGLGYKQSTVKGGVVTLGKDMLTGYSAFDWSTLDFENHWSVVLNGTPILKNFASSSPSVAGRTKAFDTSWYDEKADASVIKNTKQLYGFYILSGTTNFKGKIVKLGADIAVNTGDASTWSAESAPTNKWYPIDGFAGTFDGQGHTISGIYVNSDSRYTGFFAMTANTAVVKNFSLKNSKIINKMGGKSLLSTGSIAGSGHGLFDTIYSNAFVDVSGDGAGGMFGQIYQNTTIRNCQYDGVFTNVGRYSGGIVGCVTKNTVNIENCLNTGIVKVTREEGFVNSAGILGATYNDNKIVVNITNCFNSGDVITNQGGTGSVLGHCVVGTVNITNAYATAESNTRNGNGIGYINKGTVNGSVIQLPESMMLGTDGYRATELDFNTYWAAIANKTPQLKSFAGNGLSVAGLTKLYDMSWYDPAKSEYTLTDSQDLYGLTLLSMDTDFSGKTVKLGESITLNEGDADTFKETPPKQAWIPISKFAGTFDGQGKSIKGLYVASGSKVGLFSETTKTAVVKNLKLEEAYVNGTSSDGTGSIVGKGGGTFSAIYSDAIVNSTNNSAGGIIGFITVDTTMDQVQFAGTASAQNQVGGFASNVNKANATFTDCHMSGTAISERTTKGHTNLGLFVGMIDTSSDVVAVRCLGTGYIQQQDENSDKNYTRALVGKVTGNDAVFHGENTNFISDVEHITNASLGYIGVYGKHAGVTYTNCGWKAGHVGTGIFRKQVADITGANALYNCSNLGLCDNAADTSKAWVAIEGGTPQLRIFATGTIVDLTQYVKADTTWYTSGQYAGTKEEPYIIADAGDLLGLSNLVNGGNPFAGKYIELGDDIVYNTDAPATLAEWGNYTPKNTFTPIGTWGKLFKGNFNGNGFGISGIYVKKVNNERFVGLFGAADGGTIENFKLTNSYFEANAQVGSICGRAGDGTIGTTFKNIESSAIVVSRKYEGAVENEKDRLTGTFTGGILGLANDSIVKMENCKFTGEVKTAGSYAGGMIGTEQSSSQIELKNCSMTGTINCGSGYAGGLVGYINGSTADVLSCTINSTINANGEYIGGIAGRVNNSNDVDIEGCKVSVTITSKNAGKAGGVIGEVMASTVDVISSSVAGKIDVFTTRVGGFVGYIETSNVTFSTCLVTSTMAAKQYVGGFVGAVYGGATSTTYTVTMTDCHLNGTLQTKQNTNQHAGSLCGNINGSCVVRATRVLLTGKFDLACKDANQNARALIGITQGAAKLNTSGGVHFNKSPEYIPSVNSGYMNTYKLSTGNNGWDGTINVGTLTTEQLTGSNAVTNITKWTIDPSSTTSTWVATKTGFPTLRIFANASDIYAVTEE